MPGLLDHSVGWGAVESTYGTPVTVTKHAEWTPGNALDYVKDVKQGAGLRTGAKVSRSTRRVVTHARGDGSLKFDFLSKGLGLPLQAAFGTGVSTLVAGSTFQQLFTPTQTNTLLPSLTIQEGIVQAGGTVDAYTWAGCSVKSFQVDCPNGDIITVQFDIDARSLATGTAYVSPVLPSGGTLFHFGSGVVTFGGTLTVPTTTALGSVAGGTGYNVRSWSLKVDNALDLDRLVVGAVGSNRNQPTVGNRSIQFTAEIEYDSVSGTILRDAHINETPIPILVQATTAEVLSTGVATLQFAMPATVINSGPIPQPSDDKTIVTQVEFEVLDNSVAAQALYGVVRTADAAL